MVNISFKVRCEMMGSGNRPIHHRHDGLHPEICLEGGSCRENHAAEVPPPRPGIL